MGYARKIVVFGESGINDIKSEEGEFTFAEKNFSGHFADYDITIYSVGAFPYKFDKQIWSTTVQNAPAPAIQRANEIHAALERGRIVCFIGANFLDYVVSETLFSNGIQAYNIDGGRVFRISNIKRSEFKPYLDDLGGSAVAFTQQTVDNPICYAYQQFITGFSKSIGKGTLLFIPTIWGSDDIRYVVDHLKSLVRAIISYSARELTEAPKFLEDFRFSTEKKIEEKINQIKEQQIKPLDTQLEQYKQIKSILWLGDHNLVNAVNVVFTKIGCSTLVDEIYEEDLWIVKNGEKQVIVEIKGLNNNLTRQDISKLDEHREARLIPNLTGLLIANTFRTADSMASKDQAFSPNVIEKAVNVNVLITRTIDLCRIIDHLQTCGQDIGSTLEKDIVNKKGWLTFDQQEIKIIT